MGEIKGTAHLRELEATRQCELMFNLKVEIDKIGLLQEDVVAVRQITDNVQSLLQHTVNKLKTSIKNLQKDRKIDNLNDVGIHISLINGSTRKAIKSSMVLQSLFNSKMKHIRLHVFGKHYIVVLNAPVVKEMKLPVNLFADFTVQASRFMTLFTESNVSQFSWFKSIDKEKWIQISKGQKYKIVEDDVGHYLKLVCVPCNSILTGPSAEVISQNKVDRIGELPICPFEERHKFTTTECTDSSFRFVTYNVLANRYAEPEDAFPYCPSKFLAIDYRKQLIAKELLGYKADIICLQEVDNNVYVTYYKDVFKKEGYMSFYHRKGNRIPEGLACFFKTSRFKKIDDYQIIYTNLIKKKTFAYLWEFLQANSDLKDLFMKQMTSLHVTVLRMKHSDGNNILIVGNTHLFYRPDAELVRIIQINLATSYLHSVIKQYAQNENDKSVTVILCGDFNSKPESSVFEYLTQRQLDTTHVIFEDCKNPVNLINKFQFLSACGTPKYTNYTYDFKGCLDYIFIEKDKLRIDSIVPFPTEDELAKFEGLPSEVYPSDHLALVADLEFVC